MPIRNLTDRGFTLVEAMVAITIIGAVVAAQASLLVLGAAAQNRLSTQRLASGVLQSEIEQFQTAPWDDIMMQPTLAPNQRFDLCSLSGNSKLRSSAQIVKPLSVIREGDVTFTVTRNVVWTTTGTPVECSPTTPSIRDRADTKTLTVTVSWKTEEGDKSRTGSIVLSRNRVNAEEIRDLW